MATLTIVEFRTSQVLMNGLVVQVAQVPAVATQSLTVSGTATTSAAFNPNTSLVRISMSADVGCALEFSQLGTTIATALATSMPLPASGIEYFGLPPVIGTASNLSVSAMTTSGT